MDYIFKEWEKRLSDFEGSVEKDIEEIRQCKADIQQLKSDLLSQVQRGRFVRDEQRLILSAPEIVIGNVDMNGCLYGDGASTIVVRGNQIGLHGTGEGAHVEVRSPGIRQIAEDPGPDGLEHVVDTVSEIVSQARDIVIQSNDAEGAFSEVIQPAGGSGVRIYADQSIEINAAPTAESRETRLKELIDTYKEQKGALKEQVSLHKSSFKDLVKEMEDKLKEKEKLLDDDTAARTNYQDIYEIDDEIERLSGALSEEVFAYSQALSMLSEVNRQISCFTQAKDAVKKGDEFKKESTGASVTISGEKISLASVDGEGNIRDNEGAGIDIVGNEVNILSAETDGKLKEKGQVRIQAKTVEVTTAGADKVEYDDSDNTLKTAAYAAEGDIIMKSKNITIEGVDYEVKEKKLQEKSLTADSKISVRAKTIEVSTENSANVEVDDKGKLKKANYTAEGDLIVRSKTVTVESVDYDLEDGKLKEKAFTKDGKFSLRTEQTDISATDTEGKATGSVAINAKAVSVRSMDVEKEKRTDDKLAAGSTMLLLSEKIYAGAKSKDIKSKKVQVVTEELGLFADKTFEAQQGDGKAVLQLDGGNASLGGSKTQVYGATTINAKTEIKGDLKAPKAAIDNLEAKSSFKSPNISDGIAIPGAPSSSSLSAKLKTEDVK